MSVNPAIPGDGTSQAGTPPQPRKFANKYDTVEALEQGYAHSSREAVTLNERLKSAEARARTAELALESMRPAPQDPLSGVRERMAEGTHTPEDIEAVIGNVVPRLVQSQLAPLLQAARAQAALDPTLLPDAQKLLAADATLSDRYTRIVSVDPEAGAQYLDAQVRARRAEAGMNEEDANVRRQREAERRDAGIVTGTSESRGTTSPEGNEARKTKVKELLDYTRQTSDYKGLASELLRDTPVWRSGDPGFTKLT